MKVERERLSVFGMPTVRAWPNDRYNLESNSAGSAEQRWGSKLSCLGAYTCEDEHIW